MKYHKKLYAFGYSKHGQLGINPTDGPVYPTEVGVIGEKVDDEVKGVSCGAAYTTVVSKQGVVYSFGDMRGSDPKRELVWNNMQINKIVSSAMFDLALLKNGNVFIWGKLTSTPSSSPSPSPSGDFGLPKKLEVNSSGFTLWNVKIADVAAGALHALLLSTSGTLYAFGSNSHGQLGIPSDQNESALEKPQEVSYFTKNKLKISQIACGGSHSIVLTKDGQAFAFGANKYGQLGTGDNIDKNIPTPLYLSTSSHNTVTQVACGDYHTLLVIADKLYSCGSNKNGQLGLGHYRDQNRPSIVSKLSSYNIVKMAAGGGYSCSHSLVIVALGLGTLFSFGSGGSGQLGYEVTNNEKTQPEPQLVKCFEKKLVLDVACGWLHSMVIVEDDKPSEKQSKVEFSFLGTDIPDLGHFSHVPSDLFRLILESLEAEDLSRLACVSKFFTLITTDNILWERLTKKKFKYVYNSGSHWKTVFVRAHEYNYGKRPALSPKSFMGSLIDDFVKGIFSKPLADIAGKALMVGLDAAGKTTILYRLKLGEIVTTIPTIGFNVETVSFKKGSLYCWDVGGPDKIRPLWRHYYQSTEKLIFVIDSNDRDRLSEAQLEIGKIVREDDLRDLPLLIFANKQDLPNAMGVAEISDKIGLSELSRNRECFIQASCATSGDGLYEGFSWLSSAGKKL